MGCLDRFFSGRSSGKISWLKIMYPLISRSTSTFGRTRACVFVRWLAWSPTTPLLIATILCTPPLVDFVLDSFNRVCYSGFPHSTRLRCAAILHRLCVSVPAASIGLGRIMPELLLLHLEADGGWWAMFSQSRCGAVAEFRRSLSNQRTIAELCVCLGIVKAWDRVCRWFSDC